jgi:hypothetical protein
MATQAGSLELELETSFDEMPFYEHEDERQRRWALLVYLGPEFCNVPLAVPHSALRVGSPFRTALSFQHRGYMWLTHMSSFMPGRITRHSRLMVTLIFEEQPGRFREVAGTSIQLVHLVLNRGTRFACHLQNKYFEGRRPTVHITACSFYAGSNVVLDESPLAPIEGYTQEPPVDYAMHPKNVARETYNDRQYEYDCKAYDTRRREPFNCFVSASPVVGQRINLSYLLNQPVYDSGALASHEEFWVRIMDECTSVRDRLGLPLDPAVLWCDMLCMVPARYCEYMYDRYGDWFSKVTATLTGDCEDMSRLIKELHDDLVNLPQVKNTRLREIQGYASLYIMFLAACSTHATRVTASVTADTDVLDGHMCEIAIPMDKFERMLFTDDGPDLPDGLQPTQIALFRNWIQSRRREAESLFPEARTRDLPVLLAEGTNLVEPTGMPYPSHAIAAEQDAIELAFSERMHQVTFVSDAGQTSFYDRIVHLYTSFAIERCFGNEQIAYHGFTPTNPQNNSPKHQYGVTCHELFTPGQMRIQPQPLLHQKLIQEAIRESCMGYPATLYNTHGRFVDYPDGCERILDIPRESRARAKKNMQLISSRFVPHRKDVVPPRHTVRNRLYTQKNAKDPHVHVTFFPVDMIADSQLAARIEQFITNHCLDFEWKEVEINPRLVDYRLIFCLAK